MHHPAAPKQSAENGKAMGGRPTAKGKTTNKDTNQAGAI